MFDKSVGEDGSLAEYRTQTFLRVQELVNHEFESPASLAENPLRHLAFVNAVGSYDWSLLAKQTLLYNFCIMAIRGSGTKQHQEILRLFQVLSIGLRSSRLEIKPDAIL